MTLMLRASLLALPLLLAACSSSPPKDEGNYSTISSNQFIDANYKAADSLMHQLNGKLLADKPLIMATIVNIDALEQTTTLGRLVSEQLSTRLAQGRADADARDRRSGDRPQRPGHRGRLVCGDQRHGVHQHQGDPAQHQLRAGRTGLRAGQGSHRPLDAAAELAI
jgi:hypothetical protein